jgi:hypothetical protein
MGQLPRPDVVVIADTGREVASTWQYLDQVTRPALEKIGIEVHRIGQEWATVGLFSTKGSVLMPAFSSQVLGASSKLKNWCSNEWKVRVIKRYLVSLGIPTKEQKRWIGYSLNESRRALAMMEGEEYQSGQIRFPLIHDVPMRRDQAISFVVNKMGWPHPPRSSCWCCPNHSDDDWRRLTKEELKAARELEIELQEKDPFVWLHKSCVPIDQVNLEPHPEFNFGVPCDSGVCFV